MISTIPGYYRDQAISKMGKRLGELYIQLVEELFMLNTKWTSYSLLFRVTKERVDLLNDYLSGSVAAVIQDSMLDSVVLSISYLGDTNRCAFKLERFKEPLKKAGVNKEIQDDLIDLIAIAKDTAKDLRNEHIAHHANGIYLSNDRDYNYPTYERIDEICDRCHTFINELAKFYGIEPFACYYKTNEGKLAKFFCILSGELARDDKFGLKLWNKKHSEWGHLRPILDRFLPSNVYARIAEGEQNDP